MVLVSEPMRCAANKTCHWEQQAIRCMSPSQSKPSTVTSGTGKGGQTASSRWSVRPPTPLHEPQPCTPGTPVPCRGHGSHLKTRLSILLVLLSMWPFSSGIYGEALCTHSIPDSTRHEENRTKNRAMGNVAKQQEELPVGKGKRFKSKIKTATKLAITQPPCHSWGGAGEVWL